MGEVVFGRTGERLHEWAFGEQGKELLSALVAGHGLDRRRAADVRRLRPL